MHEVRIMRMNRVHLIGGSAAPAAEWRQHGNNNAPVLGITARNAGVGGLTMRE